MNSSDFIIQLFKLWRENKLSHFNIIYGKDSETVEKHLSTFLSEVISNELRLSPEKSLLTLQQGHPDILYVSKSSPNNRPYRIQDGDFKEMLNFLEYKPLNMSKRFILVREAHLLSYEISNKLLKVLEEPAPNTIIFFLSEKGGHFIQTLISRARQWTINEADDQISFFQNFANFQEMEKDSESFKEIIEKSSQLSLSEFQHYLAKNKKFEDFLKATLSYATNHLGSGKDKELLLTALKDYHQQKPFNGSHSHILARIYGHFIARGA